MGDRPLPKATVSYLAAAGNDKVSMNTTLAIGISGVGDVYEAGGGLVTKHALKIWGTPSTRSSTSSSAGATAFLEGNLRKTTVAM